MKEEIKVLFTNREVDGKIYKNYYLKVGENLIPIEVKYFKHIQHYWDEKHLSEVAEELVK